MQEGPRCYSTVIIVDLLSFYIIIISTQALVTQEQYQGANLFISCSAQVIGVINP